MSARQVGEGVWFNFIKNAREKWSTAGQTVILCGAMKDSPLNDQSSHVPESQGNGIITATITNTQSQRYVGLFGGAKAWLISELHRNHQLIVVICKDRKSCEDLTADLQFFEGPQGVTSFSAWDTLPFEPVSPQTLVSAQRLQTLRALQHSSRLIVVVPVEALAQRIPPASFIASLSFEVRLREAISRDALARKLERAGFQPVSVVEEIGEMAVRGSVIDFFPVGTPHPVRIEFVADSIEKIKTFDADTQRSLATLDTLFVTPVRERLPVDEFEDSAARDRVVERIKARAKMLETPPREVVVAIDALTKAEDFPGLELLNVFAFPKLASFLEYIPARATVLINDEIEIERSLDATWDLISEREARLASEHQLIPPKEEFYIAPEHILQGLREKKCIYLDQLDILNAQEGTSATHNVRATPNTELAVRSKSQVGTGHALKPLSQALNRFRRDGFHVAFVVGSPVRAERLQRMLLDINVDAHIPGLTGTQWLHAPLRYPIVILQGYLSAGMQLPEEKLVFIAEAEIFAERSYRRAASARTSLKRLMSSLAQLQEGDFIVHVDYGIGVYHGLKHLEIEGMESDFLHIEYADSRLYLPVQNIGKIQKFTAAEGQKPILDKLGSNTWVKTKQKVKDSVVTLAGDLIKLYATREVAKGWRFEPPGAEDDRFADGFPFDETPDQNKAIQETLLSMAEDKPMDRLVCGDVGFGKTEVALRAAFKCTQHARQVAVLVPTTILVEQHRMNFVNRFADSAVKIGAVSRFYSAADNKKTLEDLAKGKLDIIIGTHRLLSQDVEFKDLGLVIIDEEHRFGVKQKEKLKQLKKQVDVLTLTATPIPRTLHMSLLGIRDISVISTPPHDRRIIRTYVAEHSDSLIRDTILRELQRGGQCFVVHNRIEGIDIFTADLQRLVPEARFQFAHGQMNETQLEDIMQKFLKREIDVLVSTTIIESGLDIPNANTIIIDRADTFGLAQLYQLRGRVGRSTRQAYAYLIIPHTRKLGAEAQQRLKALQSLDDLGLGFNLAIRDLEIRGAGNLLGKEQSGSVLAVGFELYTKILKEAVLNLKGEELALEESIDPEVKLGMHAFIPDGYIPDISERLVLYQRLASINSDQEAQELTMEIEDRFGPIPLEVVNLIELMRYRSMLKHCGITKAEVTKNKLLLNFSPRAIIEPAKVVKLVQEHPEIYKFTKSQSLSVALEKEKIESPSDIYVLTERLLKRINKNEAIA
ncbi:MAG: transcription-repair coupling factor [Deltaproteobacteria bacterium]|nr:transcription-repair coupling factor [Deltaproteobacteria bacterium]